MAVGHGGGGIVFFCTDRQLQKTVLKNIDAGELGFLSDGRYVVLNDHGATLYTPPVHTPTFSVTSHD